jgi:hypothetical protein
LSSSCSSSFSFLPLLSPPVIRHVCLAPI